MKKNVDLIISLIFIWNFYISKYINGVNKCIHYNPIFIISIALFPPPQTTLDVTWLVLSITESTMFTLLNYFLRAFVGQLVNSQQRWNGIWKGGLSVPFQEKKTMVVFSKRFHFSILRSTTAKYYKFLQNWC